VYASVALCLAGRGIEAYNITVGDVTRVEDSKGNAAFHFHFERAKNHTTTSSDRNLAVMNGKLEVAALDSYIALRPAGPLGPVEKAKKFFR
jgi:hypothetical protein